MMLLTPLHKKLNSRCLPPADHADTALLAPIRPFRSKRLAKTVPLGTFCVSVTRNDTKSPKSLRRMTNLCAVLDGQMAKVEREVVQSLVGLQAKAYESKTRRNSPDFAVVCQPNVRSRHHSAPFRTVSEGCSQLVCLLLSSSRLMDQVGRIRLVRRGGLWHALTVGVSGVGT